MAKTVIPSPQSRIRAAVARADITPPVGMYHRMWGAARHDQSTGVHRPLTATALCIAPESDDEPPTAFLAIDHCLLWHREMTMLLADVAEQAEIAPDRIVVFFSHTHAAGLMGLERKDLPGGEGIPGYLKQMSATCAGLIRQSLSVLEPATINYGIGRCSLAANRDYFDAASGQYVCGFNPDGIADDTVVAAKLTRDDGTTLGTIVNYACHPTTLAWDNRLVSPDYVGATREVVESATNAPCFFIQGASGDIGPREGFVGDPAVADRNGRQLGYATLAALEALPNPGTEFAYSGPVISGATIGTWTQRTISDQRAKEIALWRQWTVSVELPFRSDLGTAEELQVERTRWETAEQKARDNHDDAAAAEARAMLERATRRLTRLATLPKGSSYPYQARLWRMGDAVWIAFEGEHYNVLQRTLRERFPGTPIIVGTLANGSNVWYLPDAESYGKGLYQESASVLAKGALETLIDACADGVAELLKDTTA